jgi:hypothetical protein
MTPQRKEACAQQAKLLEAKANCAWDFDPVRSLLLSGAIRFPRVDGTPTPLAKGQRLVTAHERKVLATKGNAAIKMNDLFRLTREEFLYVQANAPQHIKRWVRMVDYDPDLWWAPDHVEAQAPSLRENWNAARSLALMGEHLDQTAEAETENDIEDALPSEHTDDDVDCIRPRDALGREDSAEVTDTVRLPIMTGEDNWTDTEYPVLESQASFMARGSNDDLDELFGEEPRDTREQMEMRITKARGWRASKVEEAYQESSVKSRHPCAHVRPSNSLPEIFGDQPSPKFNESGKLTAGFFISRSEFFAQRDMMLENMDSEYNPKPSKRRSPGPMDLELIRHLDAGPTAANPAAPDRPYLKKGQKHLIVRHRPSIVYRDKKTKKLVEVQRTVLCAPSE